MKASIAIIFLLLSLSPASYAADLAQGFNFDGYLTDSSNYPLAGPVNLKLQIYNPSETCLLFEETHTAVALDSVGAFSVKVGSGTRANSTIDGGLKFRKIFQNYGNVRSVDSTYCSTAYTPSAEDGRKLKVTVNDTVVLSPSYNIAPVPMASVAESVQGKTTSELLLLDTSSEQTMASTLKTRGVSLANGPATNANYVMLKSAAALAANLTFYLPTSYGSPGHVLTTDGSGNLSWTVMTGGGGGITDVTVAYPLSINSSGSARSLALITSGVVQGNYGTSTMIPTLTINEYGMITAANQTAMPTASSSTSGYLNAADFILFNSKQDPLGYTPLSSTQNLVDLSNIPLARTNLGLGTASTRDIGTSSGNIPVLDGSGQLSTFVLPDSALLNGGTSAGTLVTIGTNDANSVYLKTNNTKRMKIETSGNTIYGDLIDTVSPTSLLYVATAMNTSTFRIDTFGASNFPRIDGGKAKGSPGAPEGTVQNDKLLSMRGFAHNGSTFYTTPTAEIALIADANSSSYSGGGMTFSTDNNTSLVERMRIDHLGNVGMGTATPETHLHVNSSGSTTLKVGSTGATPFPGIQLDSPTNQWHMGLDGTDGSKFKIRDIDASYTTRFTIDGLGKVGVGTSSPSYNFDVVGSINFTQELFVAGVKACDNGGCSYISSDKNLKEKIAPLVDSFEKIQHINGVSYFWKDKDKYGKGEQVGVVAQDVERVYPQLVNTDSKTGHKTVMYAHLIGPIIEAFKALVGQHKTVARDVASLQKENALLKEELEKNKSENKMIKAWICAKDAKASICK